MIEAFLGGVFLALSLLVVARFLPDIELSAVAALAACLTSAFVRYYLGLWIDDADFGGEFPGDMDLEETD